MFDESNDPQDKAFEILGIHQGANATEVRAAYRKLASKYHPDRVAHLAEEFRELARSKMAVINHAYASVRDVQKSDSERARKQRERRLGTVTNDRPKPPSSRLHDEPEKKPLVRKQNSSNPPRKEKAVEVQINFSCPCCESKITVPHSSRGKRGQCTRCRQMIVVPSYIELRCKHCNQRNRLPIEMSRKRAVCRKCYGSLASAKALRLGNS